MLGGGGRAGGGRNGYYGGDIKLIGEGQSSLYTSSAAHAWAGSSEVMLSSSSSLNENIILIPDNDWIELQISRNQARLQSSSKGGFFFRSRANKVPEPPKRVALPSVIDPVQNSDEAMILYSITASNSNDVPWSQIEDSSKLNTVANTNLWNAIQKRLKPKPLDAFPCWSHNSLSQFREDGFTLMYPESMRNEAKLALILLAEEFGQSSIYEYVSWTETPSDKDYGTRGIRGVERAGSIRRVGKDGSAIVIAPLPKGRTDVMIRTTIPTDPEAGLGSSQSRSNKPAGEPVVVMRRVKDLPVEDELTSRDWEGPPLEDIVWNT